MAVRKQVGHMEVEMGVVEPVCFSQTESFDRDIKWLTNWAILLNSPWDYDTAFYEIKAYKETIYGNIKKGFVCKYAVIGYDYMNASVMGYGQTPEEALKNCMIWRDKIQKEYNPERKYF